MNNENKSIHEFDFNLICEYFSSLERQGPGSPEVTIKALSFIDNLTYESHIADIGCGTGGQTIVMAQQAPGHITGIDLFPVATFILPENCWTEHFYAPQVMAQDAFLKKHAGNKTAEEFIASERHEAQLYYKYKEYYGYTFYIGKKV